MIESSGQVLVLFFFFSPSSGSWGKTWQGNYSSQPEKYLFFRQDQASIRALILILKDSFIETGAPSKIISQRFATSMTALCSLRSPFCVCFFPFYLYLFSVALFMYNHSNYTMSEKSSGHYQNQGLENFCYPLHFSLDLLQLLLWLETSTFITVKGLWFIIPFIIKYEIAFPSNISSFEVYFVCYQYSNHISLLFIIWLV